MIIPTNCFTCGKPIAHLWLPYQRLVNKSQDQNKEFKALALLKIGRVCCRRMFLCQQDMYDKVR